MRKKCALVYSYTGLLVHQYTSTPIHQHLITMKERLNIPGRFSDILKISLEKWNLASTFKRHEMLDHWNSLAGPQIAAKSRPLKFQGEFLIVEVDHPAWVQELNLLKGHILNKIGKDFPKSGVKN